MSAVIHDASPSRVNSNNFEGPAPHRWRRRTNITYSDINNSKNFGKTASTNPFFGSSVSSFERKLPLTTTTITSTTIVITPTTNFALPPPLHHPLKSQTRRFHITSAIYNWVAPVRSDQREPIHPDLAARVERHLKTTYRKPIPQHSISSFKAFLHECALREENRHKPIIIDTTCGSGESTLNLARIHPDCIVVGIDRGTWINCKFPAHTNPALKRQQRSKFNARDSSSSNNNNSNISKNYDDYEDDEDHQYQDGDDNNNNIINNSRYTAVLSAGSEDLVFLSAASAAHHVDPTMATAANNDTTTTTTTTTTITNTSPSCCLVRGDVYSFYKLVLGEYNEEIRLELGISEEESHSIAERVLKNYMLYPFPHPRRAAFKRRIYCNALFSTMIRVGKTVELRTNWKVFIDEFVYAYSVASVLYYLASSADPSIRKMFVGDHGRARREQLVHSIARKESARIETLDTLEKLHAVNTAVRKQQGDDENNNPSDTGTTTTTTDITMTTTPTAPPHSPQQQSLYDFISTREKNHFEANGVVYRVELNLTPFSLFQRQQQQKQQQEQQQQQQGDEPVRNRRRGGGGGSSMK